MFDHLDNDDAGRVYAAQNGKVLRVYVDNRTFSILSEYAQRTGRSVEELAEAAIAEEALRSIHPTAR